MEAWFAIGVGLVAACGVYLLLRPRTFSVVLGLSLSSYATNLLLFGSGRLAVGRAPVIDPARASEVADPLPQALVLTAIVIGLGMTALAVVLAVRARAELGSDHGSGREPRGTP